MDLHVIIHPGQDRALWEKLAGETFNAYQNALEQIVEENEHVFAVRSEVAPQIDLPIPNTNVYDSPRGKRGAKSLFTKGEVSQRQAEEFYGRVDEIEPDTCVVHGSYFGTCTLQFAMQYYLWTQLGIESYGEKPPEGMTPQQVVGARLIGEMLGALGQLSEQEDVRYGHTLEVDGYIDALYKQSSPADYPRGRPHEQLIRAETVRYVVPLPGADEPAQNIIRGISNAREK